MQTKLVKAKSKMITEDFQSIMVQGYDKYKQMQIRISDIIDSLCIILVEILDDYKVKFKFISADQMKESERQISEIFFNQCQNLDLIEKPFSIEEIIEQSQIRDLENQFELIRALTETKKHRMKLRSNTALENKANRYPEQAVYQHSRVVLLNSEDNNQEGYINANFIPVFSTKSGSGNRLILTQGPTENTVGDFRKMIQQQEIECVVMLCRLMENGKSRCSDYLGNCKLETDRKISDYLTVKKVNLGESFANHTYEHVYYSEWPDKKVPSELDHISELIELIHRHKRIAIHCSAGLGRSGVIAALLLIIWSDSLLQEQKISVFQTVRRIREYRFGAVQNSQQYAFLYRFFADFIKTKLIKKVTMIKA